MKLCLKNSDFICIEKSSINIIVDNQKYSYSKEDIEAVMLITNDLGPVYDDLCLALSSILLFKKGISTVL